MAKGCRRPASSGADRNGGVAAPSRPDCRSQIDMAVEVDHRRMVKSIQGFHALTCYGEYLREFGYALSKVGLAWENLNEPPAVS